MPSRRGLWMGRGGSLGETRAALGAGAGAGRGRPAALLLVVLLPLAATMAAPARADDAGGAGRLEAWPRGATEQGQVDLDRWDPAPVAGPASAGRRGPSAPLALLAETGLSADHDTFVSESNPGTNYASDKLVYGGRPSQYGVTYGMLWWDLGDLAENQAVTKAMADLYLRDAGPAGDADREAALHRIDWGRERDKVTCKESWDERDLNWNNKPKWRSSSEDSLDLGTARGSHSWDVTELTQRWRLPDWNKGSTCNAGLLLRVDEAGTGFRAFDSSEASNEPELRLSHVTDTTPPTASMSPLPPFVTVPNVKLPDGSIDPNKAKITLTWDGLDPAPATGIDFFRLSGRANGGEWQTLAPTLRTYGGDFEGTNGKRIEFAVQAVDPAGNEVKELRPLAVTHFDFSAPQSTVQALPAYVPGPFEVRWGGVDLPNGPGQVGSGIASWTVLYNINAGSWGLVAADMPAEQTSLRFDKVEQGLLYQFQVIATDKAGLKELTGALEAQTIVDGLAPVVKLWAGDSVDKRSFEVFWSSVDPGGSGAVSYDVQFRQGNDPWKDWVQGSAALSERFQSQPNTVFHFRARARDKAGNLGTYPDLPQLSVTTITRDRLTTKIHLPVVAR